MQTAQKSQVSRSVEGLRLVGRWDDDAPEAVPPILEVADGLEGDGPARLYCELIRAAYPELQERAAAGEANALRWLERFIELGARLGVRVTARTDEKGTVPAGAAAELVQEVLARPRIPAATYRLQFNQGFTFRDARELVPYLHALGVSDCYASPVLQARAGSSHCYDVCDHSRLNPDLGGEAEFDAFAAALRQHDMGLILDAVPNHMGIGDPGNAWWMDVLENGPGSPYAPFFDIDWRPVNPDLENKVLLPLLEDQYGRVLGGRQDPPGLRERRLLPLVLPDPTAGRPLHLPRRAGTRARRPGRAPGRRP